MTFSRHYDFGKALLNRLLQGEGLRAKAIFGGAWLGGASVAEQAVRFGRNFVLARLLTPDAFGITAIVLSSVSLVDTLTDVGVKGAVIQNPRGAEPAYLNASWWLGMWRAGVIYALIFALAPWIAKFYGDPELSILFRVALLSAIFNAAMSPRSVLPQIQMKFGRWAVISNGGGICGVIMTVVLGLFIRNAWALTIGYCCENAFRCLLSYILCPGLPTLRCDWRAAKDLLTFSRGVFGLSFLNFVIGRADVFVLGRLYSSTDLGLYAMAVALVLTPLSFLTSVLGQVLLPAMARIQKDFGRLNSVLLEVTSWLTMASLPAAVSIYLCASPLLRVVYGSRYAGAAGPLSVAAGVAFLTIVNAPLTLVLFAMGRPALHRVSVAITMVATVTFIYPACKSLGTVGGQFSALLAIIAGYVFQVALMDGLTGLNLRRYARTFVPSALTSAGILACVFAGRHFGLSKYPVADVALCLGACLAAYSIYLIVHMRSLSRQGFFSALPTGESVASLL